ncbi:MAG: glycosyltransferase family 4 protein [Rhodospirillales bacterium]|nr:MAG: glycosyltransferase family 4 protein [Rhodospirillales bacterium]
MRLMFSARALHRMAGGVERMITLIMNEMVVRGHEVDLLTWDLAGAETFFAMSPEIRWHVLNLGDPARKAGKDLMLRRATRVRDLVRRRRPDVIVCFQGGQFMAVRSYIFGLGIPVIAAERNAPTLFDHTQAGARGRTIMFNAFRLARFVTVQCESYRTLYPNFLHDRIITIPNPVFPAHRTAVPDRSADNGRFQLLSIGRLGYQKNYDCLISAFARIAERCPEWNVVIIGEGEDRPKLEDMVRAAGLEGRIVLPGTVTDPEDVYAAAHLFCLSSRWEGFPNALAEAQAHGLPAVGFAGCAGVNELIVDGATGLLAPGNGDIESLAAALARLMASPEERCRMGAAARASVRAYTPDRIMDLWEQTLQRSVRA